MRSNDIRSFIIKHYQYFIVGILFVVLVAVLVAFSGKSRNKKAESKEKESTEETAVEVPDVAFEVQEDTPVSQLTQRYFEALGEGDTDTIRQLCSSLDEKEEIRIQKKAEYVDAYENLKCYVKPGPEEGSYVVFEYYEIKFKNLDTVVPGMNSMYIRTADDGKLYIHNDKLSDANSEYMKEVHAKDDVVQLLQEIDTAYNSALESDEKVKSFMEALPTVLDNAVNNELAQRSMDSGSEEESDSPVKAKVKETVNVRSGPTTDEENKLGKVMATDTVTVLGDAGDGWSKIDYQGQEAYVKTEYLEIEGVATAIESEPAQDTAAQDEQETPSEQSGQTQTADSSSGTASKIKIKGEGVRVRDKASTDGDYLGIAGNGYEYEVKGMDGDWYKVDFKGRDGYIRKDFADPM